MTNSTTPTVPTIGISSFIELHGSNAGTLKIADDAYEALITGYRTPLGLQVHHEERKLLREGDKFVTREFLNLVPSECIDLGRTYSVKLVLLKGNSYMDLENVRDGYVAHSIRHKTRRGRLVLDEVPIQIGGEWWRNQLASVTLLRQKLYNGLIHAITGRNSDTITEAEIYAVVFSEKKKEELSVKLTAIYSLFREYFHGDMPRYSWATLDLHPRLWEAIKFLQQSVLNVSEELARPFFEHGIFIVDGSEKGFIIQEVRYRQRPYMNSDSHACRSDFTGSVKLATVDGDTVMVCQIIRKMKSESKTDSEHWISGDINIFDLYSLVREGHKLVASHKESLMFRHIISKFIKKPTTQMEHILLNTLRHHLIKSAVDTLKTQRPDICNDARAAVAFYRSKEDVVPNLASFLAEALEMLVAETEDPDEKILNKRYLCAGALIHSEFTRHLKTKSMLKTLDKIRMSTDPIRDVEDPRETAVDPSVGELMRRTKWPIYGTSREGVVRGLSRISPLDTMSHLRRITIPRDDNVATDDMRILSASQIGMICCAKTPDDMDVGIVKHLAVAAVITPVSITASDISKLISDEGHLACFDDNIIHKPEYKPVYINDTFYGYTPNATGLCVLVRKLRLSDARYRYVSIVKTGHSVSIRCDTGRLCRPMMKWNRMSHYRQGKSLQSLIDDGIVEYIDAYEALICMIAVPGFVVAGVRYTHVEIDALFVGGFEFSLNPFADTNHASRNMFQTSMACQAIAFNPRVLFSHDKTGKSLLYAQKPLCATSTYDNFLKPTHNGMNVVIAMLTGNEKWCNQEDSLIFNQRSLDAGLFVSIRVENMDIECFTHYNIRDDISYPDIGIENGLLRPGKLVTSETVVAIIDSDIGDCIAIQANVSKPGILRSIQFLSCGGKHGVARRVLRLRIDSIMHPEPGDKFTSRCSQKGVMSKAIPNDMMPYIAECGTTPDILVNPHAIPSRMTGSHIIETLLSTLYVHGLIDRPDATPFAPRVDVTNDHLGFKAGRVMIDPSTKMPMKYPVFIGLCNYLALKHQVSEKGSASGDVDKSAITGQPVGGIRKKGGLRLGAMEVSGILGHGAVHVVKESFLDNSDGMDIKHCLNCYALSTPSISNGCNKCGAPKTSIETIRVSTSLYTYTQYNEAMCIRTAVNYGDRL